MNFDQFIKLFDLNAEFRATITDEYVISTYRLHHVTVKFLDLTDQPTQVQGTVFQMTQYESGLLLLKHFGHLIMNIEFGTRSYSHPQTMQIAHYIHRYCADTLHEFNVHGDKLAAVLTQRVHFSSLHSFTMHIRDTDKFAVGYTFDQLASFEVDATWPELLPVEVLQQNAQLESVSMPETKPVDAVAYLKHLQQPGRLREVRVLFEVANIANLAGVTRLAEQFKGLKAFKAIVLCGGGNEWAIAFKDAVQAVWGQAEIRYEDMPRDEWKNVVVYRH